MPRFAMKVAYDGAPYCGFQRQKDQPSVQRILERALGKLDPSSPLLTGAGRTDSGVHAMGQVIHVDMAQDWDPFRLTEAMNFHMKPHPIAVVAAARVDDDFSARFSAIRRRYLFRILMRRAPQTFGRGTMWHVRWDLDVEAMNEAAQSLVGLHDFTTFRSTLCQAGSPIKTLERLDVEYVEGEEGPEARFHVVSRSFLHNQVRSFVGTLEQVGRGKIEIDDVARMLEARDRKACGPVSPPQGLYLAEVSYPTDIFANGFMDV